MERARIQLRPGSNTIGGTLDLSLTPHLYFPLDLFSNPNVERIGLCFATQCCKTTFCMCTLGYVIDYDPGPVMFVRPTIDDCRKFSMERVVPIIVDTEALARHVASPQNDLRALSYELDRMWVKYAWSNSEVSLRGHPIRYLYKDESSAYAPGASAKADERTKTYYNRKIIETTTPVNETDSIWQFMGLKPASEDLHGEQLWNTSAWKAKSSTTVYFMHVPCPHCRNLIRLEISQLRWPENAPIRKLDAAGWYECQVCGQPIMDGDKPEMLARHKWIADNEEGGTWVALHVNSLYMPWSSCRFGAIAQQLVRARASNDFETVKGFVNDTLALCYTLAATGVELVTIDSIEKARQDYQKNELPEGILGLALGSDVRESQVHWALLGFSAIENPGEGSHTVDVKAISWGICDSLAEFEEKVCSRTWTHATGKQMKPVTGGIDQRYKPKEVLDLVKRKRWLKAVRGEQKIMKPGTTNVMLPYSTTALERNARGKPLLNSSVGYRVNTMFWKQWLYNQFSATVLSGIDPKQKPGAFHVPGDTDKDSREFCRHLRSEHEVSKRKRGSAAVERVWEVRDGFGANHWLDSVVYALATGDAAGLFSLRFGQAPKGIIEPEDGQKEQQKVKPRYIARREANYRK